MRLFPTFTLAPAAILLAAALTLAGCGTSSSSKSGGGTDVVISTSLFAKSDSGTDRALDGSWANCDTSNNTLETHTYSGTTLTIVTLMGTSGILCTGGTTDTANSGVLTLSAQTTVMVAGWLDGSGNPSGPPTRIGPAGGSLSTLPTVTQVTATGTFGGGPATGTLLAFIDDSGTVYQLWRDASSSACAAAHSGATACLTNVDPLIKL